MSELDDRAQRIVRWANAQGMNGSNESKTAFVTAQLKEVEKAGRIAGLEASVDLVINKVSNGFNRSAVDAYYEGYKAACRDAVTVIRAAIETIKKQEW